MGSLAIALLAWLVIGGLAGWLAGRILHSGLGLFGDITVGIVGTLISGWLFNQVGLPGASGFNLWTLLVSAIGAVVLLYLAGLVWGRRSRA